MFRHKKFIKIIVVIAIIVLIALVIIILSPDNDAQQNKLDNLVSDDAQVQSYVAGSVLTLDNNDNIFGPSSAKVKIFVYEDYANRYSADLAKTLTKIVEKNKNEVAVIVRPYITTTLPLSRQAALAIDCAGDKWSKMRDRIFAAVEENSLSLDSFVSYAKDINLNEEKFTSCLSDVDALTRLNEATQETKTYSILGAPTIFIDDEMILGARPYEDYLDSNGDLIEGLASIVDRKL